MMLRMEDPPKDKGTDSTPPPTPPPPPHKPARKVAVEPLQFPVLLRLDAQAIAACGH